MVEMCHVVEMQLDPKPQHFLKPNQTVAKNVKYKKNS